MTRSQRREARRARWRDTQPIREAFAPDREFQCAIVRCGPGESPHYSESLALVIGAEMVESGLLCGSESVANLLSLAAQCAVELIKVLVQRRTNVAAVSIVVALHDLASFFESELVREVANELHKHAVPGSFARQILSRTRLISP
jgi:hypothetical protein